MRLHHELLELFTGWLAF